MSTIKPGDTFRYGGRQDDGDEGKYCKIFLHFGSKPRKRTRTKGCVTVHSTELVGGIRVTIQGTSNDDKAEVGGIRDAVYFGGCQPVFMGAAKIEGKDAFVISLGLCQQCRSPMIGLRECEWAICNVCAGKCQHEYKNGMVHGGAAGSGAMGEYCSKCGRGKPGSVDESKSDAVHKLEIERKLGICWIYTNTPFSPAEIVRMEEAARVMQN